MRKKGFVFILGICVALSFCGCSFQKITVGDQKQGTQQGAEKDTESTSTSPILKSVVSIDSGDGIYEAIPPEQLKIGVVYNGDPQIGKGYDAAHCAAINKMQHDLGLSQEQIISVTNVNESDNAAIDEAFEKLVQSGCNIIFATSYGYETACEKWANRYANVIFANCSGDKCNGSNFVNYFGRHYEARYLSGVVAGYNTKTNVVGFVAARGLENLEVTESVNAFAMGAYAVNPDCRVLVGITQSWNDPMKEEKTAEKLMERQADVMTIHCDTEQALIAAANAGIYTIGYNTDCADFTPDSDLTSVVWNWAVYYTQAVSELISGTWNGENYYGDLSDNLIDIVPISSLCAAGTEEKTEEVRKKILKDDFHVFDGTFQTNDGQSVTLHNGSSGETGFQEESGNVSIKEMNWYFRNVEVVR